jgi:hypothetical protein
MSHAARNVQSYLQDAWQIKCLLLVVNERVEVTARQELHHKAELRLQTEADQIDDIWVLDAAHDPHFTPEVVENFLALSWTFFFALQLLHSNDLSLPLGLLDVTISTRANLFAKVQLIVGNFESLVVGQGDIWCESV